MMRVRPILPWIKVMMIRVLMLASIMLLVRRQTEMVWVLLVWRWRIGLELGALSYV